MATALAALTGTGAEGTYLFALAGILGFATFVGLPDIRERVAKGKPSRGL